MMAQEPGNTRPGKRCCFAQSKKKQCRSVLRASLSWHEQSQGNSKVLSPQMKQRIIPAHWCSNTVPPQEKLKQATSPTPPIPMRSISGMRFVYDVLLSHWVDNGGPGICWRSWPIWWLLPRTSRCPSLFKVTKVIIPTFIYFSEGSKLEPTSKFCFHLLLIWLVVSSYYCILIFFWVLELYLPTIYAASSRLLVHILQLVAPGLIHLTAAWPIIARHSLQVRGPCQLGKPPKVGDFQKRIHQQDLRTRITSDITIYNWYQQKINMTSKVTKVGWFFLYTMPSGSQTFNFDPCLNNSIYGDALDFLPVASAPDLWPATVGSQRNARSAPQSIPRKPQKIW